MKFLKVIQIQSLTPSKLRWVSKRCLTPLYRISNIQPVHSLSSTSKLAQVNLSFVPVSVSASESDLDKLHDFINNNENILVMTGAGISTESGIPDYRSEGVGLYARSTNRPVQYQDFIKSAALRQRYWARNFIGWPGFSSFSPNTSHKILREWEASGKVHWLVTQNVDALHTKAGSERVTELHGSAHRVMCLNCDLKMRRTELQELIQSLNPDWQAETVEIAPDGDVQLSSEQIQGFKVPACPNCRGVLKPEIIFFGDSVPKTTVNFIHDRVKKAGAIFVIGSSLQVYSGYRFVIAAHEQKKPIALLNIGPTRADKLADIKVSALCSDVLKSIRNSHIGK